MTFKYLWKVWQAKPNWLKGGIITVTMLFVMLLVNFIRCSILVSNCSMPLFLFFFILPIPFFIVGSLIGKIISVKRIWLKGMLLGGVIGALIWLYDFDFLLSFAGGASPTISRNIIDILGLSHTNFFAVLFILIIALGIFGLIIGLLADLIITNLIITKVKSK